MTDQAGKDNHVTSIPVFNLAFRSMFLLASIFSIVALTLWGLSLAGLQIFTPYGGAFFWHAHEMIFGFVSAVMVGFLLTAAENWTGLRAPHGKQLALLSLLWLSARIVMLIGEPIPSWLIFVTDLSFTALAALYLYQMLRQKKQYRNYFAVIALLLITVCNGLTHFSLHYKTTYVFTESLYVTVLIITLMMTVLGGRVIPMFTANATGLSAKPRLHGLETAIMVNVWLLIAMSVINLITDMESTLLALPFFSCAFFIAMRSLRWRFRTTVAHPLLWSLQLSYWFIPLGLSLIGLHHAFEFNRSLAIHTLTVGAMGGMILSMMSRVSLGHTGRPIRASSVMTFSFLAIIAAVIVRVAFVMSWPASTPVLLWTSILLWIISYGLFVFTFSPFLIGPRADGKPG